MDGKHSLLKTGTYGTFYKSGDKTYGGYQASLENGWYIDLYFDMGHDFNGHDPRCPNWSDCDTSGWKYLSKSDRAWSTITKYDNSERYVINDFWGQVGYNAGGVHVMPMDGHAFGIWIKEWTHQKYMVDYNPCEYDNGVATADLVCVLNKGGSWVDWAYGSGGDINGNKIPIPAAWILFSFGLVGLRALGIIRKKA